MSAPGLLQSDQTQWLKKTLAGFPWSQDRILRAQHARTAERKGIAQANCELRETIELYPQPIGWPADNASDAELSQWADGQAESCDKAMRVTGGDEIDAYLAGRRFCEARSIPPPVVKGGDLLKPVLQMRCPRWWRRRARENHGRRVERKARVFGVINKRHLHISDDMFSRIRARDRRNWQCIESTVLECVQTGERIALADAVDSSTANKRIRRGEMMMRIRGLEEYATRKGHQGVFITWTAPPEYHALHSKSGKRLDGRHTTPREGHDWLNGQWRRCRAALARAGVKFYGLRVVEPHHDGTPHWHCMLFVDAARVDVLVKTMRAYAINGDHRAKRQRHACDAEIIDRSHGSAVGYVAKYIGKNIDGVGVGEAQARGSEGDAITVTDASEKAQRACAWASLWGIRQFQFIGEPPITVWRELRRLKRIADNFRAEKLRSAADQGQILEWIELMGGPAIPRNQRPARIEQRPDGGIGRYGDLTTRPFMQAYGSEYASRPLKWISIVAPRKSGRPDWLRIAVNTSPIDIAGLESRLRVLEKNFQTEWAARSGAAASTWTRGNNCMQDGPTVFRQISDRPVCDPYPAGNWPLARRARPPSVRCPAQPPSRIS